MWVEMSNFFALFMVLTGAFFTSAKPLLLRSKRWDSSGDMSSMFRGTAGVDYPDLKKIPTTSFRCEEQAYEGGLYADVETKCQVYHVCHDGRKDSFMCGRGTVFNQQILACDYWYSTECENAPSFYYINSQIGNGFVPKTSKDVGQHQTSNNGKNYYHGNSEPEHRISDFNNENNQKFGNPFVSVTSPKIGRYDQPQNGNPHFNSGNDQTLSNGAGASQNFGSQYPNTEGSSYEESQNFNNRNKQNSCQCWQSSNKTPWSFPAAMVMTGIYS